MTSSSLWWRAALAVALMIGFYALAAAIVFVCWGGAFGMVMGGGRIPIKLLVFMVIGGGIVLWSILPRWDRFVPPGPRLLEAQNPRLFDVVRGVAEKTGQPVPAEVYLVEDVNAFVANRGGVMGFGSRPVMGLGLPLLQALTIPEMSAVIAHEFGHYVEGDTRIGPWIYKTRAALARSVDNLAEANSILVYPFVWYMKMFLRVTHAVSRHQEYQADAISARVTSAEAAGHALRKVHAVAPAYDAYWRNEVVPVLVKGHRPPIGAGFAHFLGEARIADLVRKAMAEAPEATADPYDTHPPLSERLLALGQLDAPPATPDAAAAPAITLLGDVARAEDELIRGLLRPDLVVQPVRWEEVGPAVYLPLWTEAAKAHPALAELTPLDVRMALTDPVRLASRIAGNPVSAEDAPRAAAHYAGGVLGRAFVAAGYSVESLPGRAVTLRRGDIQVDLDELLEAARENEALAWRAHLLSLGLDEAALSRPNSA